MYNHMPASINSNSLGNILISSTEYQTTYKQRIRKKNILLEKIKPFFFTCLQKWQQLHIQEQRCCFLLF